MMLTGALMLLVLVALGLHVMVVGSWSRFLVRAFFVLLGLSVVVGSLSPAALGTNIGVLAAVLAPLFAARSFWRVLFAIFGRLRARGREEANAMEDARRSSRAAILSPPKTQTPQPGSDERGPGWVD